jgi:hypothetical protein
MKFKAIFLCLFLALILSLPSPSIPQPRDPSKVYKVAILPFMIYSQENLDYLREGIYDILISRITVEGRAKSRQRHIALNLIGIPFVLSWIECPLGNI